ncbi:cupin domain-containing protein [Agarilytica rhodophyticola]|uniref:cupin domain-containing protein n=1 Tax=Agarilytica rhodophyticola TaxID=1737490 RepID=UPI000B343C2C|nr:hypothetical protein [Agarilytica rhodophyticola]
MNEKPSVELRSIDGGKNTPFTGMHVVNREDIPQISTVFVDNKEHNLGLLKDFRKHELLANFIPDSPERVSFSWVRLLPGETLAVHAHPTKTFIIVCEGEGYCTGDYTGKISGGSIVMVAPNFLHGFCGAGKNGFWALSIQFEGLGLYENTEQARVKFEDFEMVKPSMRHISEAQEFFLEDYKRNPLFSIIKEDNFQTAYREPLLDAIQHWSQCFQLIISDRVKYAQSNTEKKLALMHLEEEKDHDTKMAALRGNPDIGDLHPIANEVTNWFRKAMKELSDAEKIILVHFVLEGSAEFAHNEIHAYVEGSEVEEHFRFHAEEDEDHVLMGVDALSNMSNVNYEKLLTSLITGWVMINRVCAQMSYSARDAYCTKLLKQDHATKN